MFGTNHANVERYLPFLAEKFKCPELSTAHRLDANTTGILLLSKTPERHAFLTRLFRERKIEKRYWAIVRGVPEPKEGTTLTFKGPNAPGCER